MYDDRKITAHRTLIVNRMRNCLKLNIYLLYLNHGTKAFQLKKVSNHPRLPLRLLEQIKFVNTHLYPTGSLVVDTVLPYQRLWWVRWGPGILQMTTSFINYRLVTDIRNISEICVSDAIKGGWRYMAASQIMWIDNIWRTLKSRRYLYI